MGVAARFLVALGALLVLLAAGVGVQLLRPLPPLRMAPALGASYTAPGPAFQPPWPEAGQASLYLDGTGWVGQTLGQTPVAIASVTKLMTALVVVRAHPLAPGEAGPTITVSAADAAFYRQELAQGDSVVPVAAGESLSELQMLVGLLLPSADNFAVMLATWDDGTEAAFVSQMNRTARQLGMRQTDFADPSGLNPDTISTASDLVRLARAVMAQPALAAIVATAEATLPLAGTVHNYDYVLGRQGVVGLKTGWTAEAGGCFVFAARRQIDGRPAELLGAVLAQPGNAYSGIVAAEDASVALLAATWPRLEMVTPVRQGEPVASVLSGWTAPARVKAVGAISRLGWPGLRVVLRLSPHLVVPPLPEGSAVAMVAGAAAGGPTTTTTAALAAPLPGPSLGWRLLRF